MTSPGRNGYRGDYISFGPYGDMLSSTKTMGMGGRYRGKGAPKAATRKRLLQQMTEAEESEDQPKMDEALAEAKRWLRQYGFDWTVLDGCARLRRAHLAPTALKEDDPT